MTRKFDVDTLVIASHNEGKVKEFREMFKGKVKTVLSANDIKLEEPEETEHTFVGNAILKAKAAALASGHVCLGDDSGLAVDALNGDPGLYSARWAVQPDGTRDFYYAMDLIKDKLGDNDNKKAQFICALALVWPDGHTETVEGDVKGDLTFPPRGDQGFGYDPIFEPTGYNITFGEMDADKKHGMSHRANAFRMMLEKCF